MQLTLVLGTCISVSNPKAWAHLFKDGPYRNRRLFSGVLPFRLYYENARTKTLILYGVCGREVYSSSDPSYGVVSSRVWARIPIMAPFKYLTINASKTSWEGSAFCSTSKAPSRWYPCLHVTCNVHVGHPTCKKENKLLVKWFAFTLRCFLIDIVDFFCDFFYASRQTHKTWRLGHFKVWATIIFVQRPMPPTPRAETGLPLYSPYECRLGYHQSEAWPVEQKALPPQFYVASVTTGSRTHTLLIKHQSLNPVLLTARPWHV